MTRHKKAARWWACGFSGETVYLIADRPPRIRKTVNNTGWINNFTALCGLLERTPDFGKPSPPSSGLPVNNSLRLNRAYCARPAYPRTACHPTDLQSCALARRIQSLLLVAPARVGLMHTTAGVLAILSRLAGR